MDLGQLFLEQSVDEQLDTVERELDECLAMDDIKIEAQKAGVALHGRVSYINKRFKKEGYTDEQRDRLLKVTQRLLDELFDIQVDEADFA